MSPIGCIMVGLLASTQGNTAVYLASCSGCASERSAFPWSRFEKCLIRSYQRFAACLPCPSESLWMKIRPRLPFKQSSDGGLNLLPELGMTIGATRSSTRTEAPKQLMRARPAHLQGPQNTGSHALLLDHPIACKSAWRRDSMTRVR